MKLAVLTGTLGLGASAHASDATPQTSKQPQQLVQYDTSKPGILVIDGSDNKTFLPLREESRSFASEEEYFAFIHSVLNFEGDDDKSLTVYQVGQLYTYTPDLQNIIPVTDPIATIIGGRYGTVVIAEKQYCIDGDRCSDPVGPFSLRPRDVYISETAVFSPNGSQTASTMTTSAASEASSHFEIEAHLEYARETTRTDWNLGNHEVATTMAYTKQLSGGFQILGWGWVPGERVCHDVPALDGGYGEACYFLADGPFIVESEGQNELFVAFTRQGRIKEEEGYCWPWEEHPRPSRKKENVAEVRVTEVARAWSKDFRPRVRFYVRPTFIWSTHTGIEPGRPSTRTYDGFDMNTDIEPDC